LLLPCYTVSIKKESEQRLFWLIRIQDIMEALILFTCGLVSGLASMINKISPRMKTDPHQTVYFEPWYEITNATTRTLFLKLVDISLIYFPILQVWNQHLVHNQHTICFVFRTTNNYGLKMKQGKRTEVEDLK